MKVDKKERSEKRKMKRRANRKKLSQAIGKRLNKNRISRLDQQQSQELDLLRLNVKLLKDAYEKVTKLNNSNFGCETQNLKFEIQKVDKKPKKEDLSENKIFKRSADEVEFSNPRVVKEEYVEFVKVDSVKSELIDQVNPFMPGGL